MGSTPCTGEPGTAFGSLLIIEGFPLIRITCHAPPANAECRRETKKESDLRNFPGLPVDKTIVRDTVHRKAGAGPDRPVGAPR